MPIAAGLPISLPADIKQFIDSRLNDGSYRDLGSLLSTAIARLRETEMPSGTWPSGGGECGALARTRAWAQTALGPITAWPAALSGTVSNIVNSPVAKLLVWGAEAPVLLYNDACGQIAGRRHPDSFGESLELAWPEMATLHATLRDRCFAGEVLFFREHTLVLDRINAPEGSVFDLFFTPIYTAPGIVGGVMYTMLDITERVRAQKILTRRGAELQAVADALPYLVIRVDREHRYRFANACSAAWYGIPADRLIGMHARDVIGEAAFEERLVHAERAMAGETVVTRAVLTDHGGRRRRIELHYMPSHDEAGQIDGVHVLAVDIEDTLRVIEEEHRDNTRFRTAMRAVHGVLWTNSADGRMLGEQPAWAELTGQSFEQYQGYGWSQAVHPDDAQPTIDAWHEAVRNRSIFTFEHRVRNRHGIWRSFRIRSLPIFDEAGAIVEWVGVHTDVTDQRNAQAALREVNETLEGRVIDEIERRRGAEARLARAQKLETIGKLTGGVAHDFNNLLQVIAGNLELLGRDVEGNPRGERRVANALAGVTRGARLASQLLAFGRRQALEPKVVALGGFVRGMEEMLRRAVGGNIRIEVQTPSDLWNSFIDPGQIESALLNLAINARDAMGEDGLLSIALANTRLEADETGHEDVRPGEYVMLDVTDTGSGIPEELLDKVFEPFFSTKAEGKGSGLGLSMVYGFVTQSGGHVRIISEPGLGTTVRLYLPRAMAAEEPVSTVEAPASAAIGGTETVLVVEDDEGVRNTVVELLGELGYRVLKSVDATSALSVIESGVPIDLLFTDVIMPGALKSPELARLARQHQPGIAVLFTSGYTENSIVHGGRLDAGVELLSKPYTRDALARKLRHVLGRRPCPATAAQTGAAGATRVLLVEDDELIRLNAAELLVEAGFEVVEAGSAEAAMAAAADRMPDILITDINLPGLNGAQLAAGLRGSRPGLAIVFASGAAEPLRAGELSDAVVLSKPYGRNALLDAARQAERQIREAAGHATASREQLV